DTQAGGDAAANFTFNPLGFREILFAFDFGHRNNFFRTQIRIVHTHRDHAAVVNRGVAADDLFDILRIDIFSADDEQVFLAADDEQFTVQDKSQIAGVVAAIDNGLCSEIRTVVIALEQAVAADQDLA